MLIAVLLVLLLLVLVLVWDKLSHHEESKTGELKRLRRENTELRERLSAVELDARQHYDVSPTFADVILANIKSKHREIE